MQPMRSRVGAGLKRALMQKGERQHYPVRLSGGTAVLSVPVGILPEDITKLRNALTLILQLLELEGDSSSREPTRPDLRDTR